MTKTDTIIIGSGIGGLATAILLAKSGQKVQIFEKNEQVGGRASVFHEKGFQFDMGPSWYLLPDVFQHFFTLIDENLEDYLELERLDPSYRIWFEEDIKNPIDFASNLEKDLAIFEQMEPGITPYIKAYLKEAQHKYELSVQGFMYKFYNSVLDFITPKMLKMGAKYSIFTPFDRHLKKYIKNERIRKVFQYPLVFLGTSPYKAPSVYSLMNHVDFNMGVFYPKGGIHSITKALQKIAMKNGVEIHLNTSVTEIIVEKNTAIGIKTKKSQQKEEKTYHAQNIVSNADYAFTEQQLLQKKHRQYSKNWWEKKNIAPSGFILYLGLKNKCKTLTHHNLYFADAWKTSFSELFAGKSYPTDPSIYVCAPSTTDATVAPPNCENVFVLVPVSAGINPTFEQNNAFEAKILNIMEEKMGIKDLKSRIIVKKRFTIADFKERYNAFKGTGLGLAQNLMQTAVFRPKTASKKVKNLYFVGANTNPGIGMPTCLISAQLVLKRMQNNTSAAPQTKLTPFKN